MLFRDGRTLKQQAAPGPRIAGAMVATFATLALIAVAYTLITQGDGRRLAAGWLLIGALAALLSVTVQYWSRWFYFLPGYVAVRSAYWSAFGWFFPRGFILVCFPLVMAAMAMLSFRLSKPRRIHVGDRVVLLFVLACFLGSVVGAFSREPKLAALGDLTLLLQYLVVCQRSIRNRKKIENTAAVPGPGH